MVYVRTPQYWTQMVINSSNKKTLKVFSHTGNLIRLNGKLSTMFESICHLMFQSQSCHNFLIRKEII
jgi:hypothetical protein